MLRTNPSDAIVRKLQELDSTATHQVVDFGPGPEDHTLGYPVQGTEAECERYAEELNANYPNLREDDSPRFCVQLIPEDD